MLVVFFLKMPLPEHFPSFLHRKDVQMCFVVNGWEEGSTAWTASEAVRLWKLMVRVSAPWIYQQKCHLLLSHPTCLQGTTTFFCACRQTGLYPSHQCRLFTAHLVPKSGQAFDEYQENFKSCPSAFLIPRLLTAEQRWQFGSCPSLRNDNSPSKWRQQRDVADPFPVPWCSAIS